MKARVVALVVVAALACLLFGKDVTDFVSDALTDKATEEARIRAGVYGAGLPQSYGDYMVAIAEVESHLNPSATNRGGPDGARGGAWGTFQLTLETARGLGYEGDGPGLLDPDINVYWATMLAQQSRASEIKDLASYWNAGVRRFSDLPNGHQTREKYVPAVLAALARVQLGEV